MAKKNKRCQFCGNKIDKETYEDIELLKEALEVVAQTKIIFNIK